MKLIALVIKQYDEFFKNQIFNFSDEYKVSFDFETNELKIDKNPDYIENFYGESIYNISPIVGINGVGKSTILNLIGYYHRAEDQNKDINQFFCIYLDTNGKFYLFDKNFDLSSIIIKELATNKLDISGYSGTPKNDNLIYIMNEDRRPSGSYGGSSLLDVHLAESSRWYILNGIFEVYEVLYSRGLVSSSYKFSFGVSKYDIPDKYLNDWENREFFSCLILKIIVKICKDFKYCLRDEEIERYFIDGNYLPLFDKIKTEIETEELKEFLNLLVNFLNTLEQIINNYEIKEYSDSMETRIVEIGYGEKNFDNRIEFEKLYLDYEKLEKNAIDLKYYGFRAIDEFYYNMSTGEANILKVMSYVKWLQMNSFQGTCQLVVDELESGMHLEWSRTLINFLVNYINEINRIGGMNFQLILTTHSPYMLSDIKPGNVIMLEKNQETGYSEGKVLQNTFAKNIQEIMKENLIDNIYGDFALAKIDSMISRLNGEEGDEEELLKEIHLISEPILRNKLLEMYDKKYNTSEFSIEKQLLKLSLTDEQRQKVRTMIEENTRNT
jgi:hypothetical protein